MSRTSLRWREFERMNRDSCARIARPLPSSRRCFRRRWTFLAVLFAVALGACFAEAQAGDPPITPTEIVQKLVQQNQHRTEHLKHYSSRRHYHVEFHGFGRTLEADMDVEAIYDSTSGKSFHVMSESGSHILLDHVLHKLLETEADDSHARNTALNPVNYKFDFQGSSLEDGRRLYVFDVEPLVKNKLLYRGKIWVDAHDYALVRLDAQPAENPSFWIKNTKIGQLYSKTGEFWFPAENRSETKVRLGGRALLTIDYGTYQFESFPQTSFAAGPLSSSQ
jgi:hypothetical protein